MSEGESRIERFATRRAPGREGAAGGRVAARRPPSAAWRARRASSRPALLGALLALLLPATDATARRARPASAVFREFLESVGEGDPARAASHFAADGCLEAPYVATLGLPWRFQGREAIAGSMSGMLSAAPDFRFTSCTIVMETRNRAVVEYASQATLPGGEPYEQRYVGIVTTRNGQIVSHREFLNTVTLARAFFPELLGAAAGD